MSLDLEKERGGFRTYREQEVKFLYFFQDPFFFKDAYF